MLSLEFDGELAVLTLNREAKRNPISRSLHEYLADLLNDIDKVPDCRFILIRSAGPVFSSGGDLSELSRGLPEGYVLNYWSRMRRTILRLKTSPQVVVAAVQGPAVGAGASLALAADMVVASETSRFRFNFVHLGLLPDAGASLLAERVGEATARDLVLTGRWMTGEEALARGLIARLVPDDQQLDATVEDVISELRRAPSAALALAKALLNEASSRSFREAIEREGVYQMAASVSSDYLVRVKDVLENVRSSATSTE